MADWYWIPVGIAVASWLIYVLSPRAEAPPRPKVRTDRTSDKAAARPLSPPVMAEVKLPSLAFEDDEELDPTRVGALESGWLSPPTTRIIYDEDAAIDEPTAPCALILVTAMGQSDKGLRRRDNEDSLLVREDHSLFVVADGMGGYRGGQLASTLAVKTIEDAFTTRSFKGAPHDTIPPRASELARAIQMANDAILRRSTADRQLEGMGTTICAAHFSPNKQRLYVGHVGDSRVYCLRDGELHQMTSDHTMKDLGMTGPESGHLSRAVGVWPTVPIDVILGKPRAGDVYLLCSDGLTKMIDDEIIAKVMRDNDPAGTVDKLIAAANEHGGKDNVSIVVVRVDEPKSGGGNAAAA